MDNILSIEKIKYINKLSDKKFRNQEHKFLVEGIHLIEEAKSYGLLLECYTTNPDYEGVFITPEKMKKISQTDSPSNILGICKMNDKKDYADKVLILDDISDPTNLGTILRSAKAFGFNTVISSLKTVDYYNDKVVRGSQGAIFKLNLIRNDLKEEINKLKKNGYQIFGTNVRDGKDIKEITVNKKRTLILGNETRGVSKEIAALVDQNLYIKLDDMESLNVSVAGSILMYEL